MKRRSACTVIILSLVCFVLAAPAAADESWSRWVGRNIDSYEKKIASCKIVNELVDWQAATDGKPMKYKIKTRKATKKEIQSCINRANNSFVKRLLKPSDDDKKLYRISKKLKKRKYRKLLKKAKKEVLANVSDCMSVKDKATKTFVKKCARQSRSVYWTRVDRVAKAIIADGKKIEKKLK